MNIGQDEPVNQGYSTRSGFAAVPQQLVVVGQQREASIPLRVAVALQFVEMCNKYTHPCGFMVNNGQDVRAEIMHPELPGPQHAALGFACKCLGDYFYGKEIPSDDWE